MLQMLKMRCTAVLTCHSQCNAPLPRQFVHRVVSNEAEHVHAAVLHPQVAYPERAVLGAERAQVLDPAPVRRLGEDAAAVVHIGGRDAQVLVQTPHLRLNMTGPGLIGEVVSARERH